ncbi:MULTISPECIES: CYTH domain-containing protein [unclassified Lactobacillus]|uniref:CYTH domain-containing protein n=1 Tax=unclassified Lactobacillus TaxID=2620435 RepID=UPI000EFC71C7|nr:MULTISPECIES: CYTH domain-containing protein [unclassified Lactobacillus]RMC24950.1 CYTH domain-containing protein [Lactobacillus sp. ESL0247]RMC29105.1 CYTH domain-containing protein [Lactobacillus sp. ESL0246]RMC32708.1 CYTH domain-containing protein [Lactobacillus sp. ESL0245]
MSENTEIEAKIIIPKSIYQKLCQDFFNKSNFTQENYYFDTDNGLLQTKRISCRVRLFNDRAEQTLKVPNPNPIQQDFHEAIEINDYLSLPKGQSLIAVDKKATQLVSFEGNVGNYLNSHFGKNCKLHVQTYSKTQRILAIGPQNCELTFDNNIYPDGYQDFELEIENSDSKLIATVLKDLKSEYNINEIPQNTNQSKIGRAFKHRVKI